MKNKYFIILIIVAVLNVAGILFFFHNSLDRSDTHLYVQTMDYFWGKAEAPSLPILVKPFAVLTVSLPAQWIGDKNALFVENLLFYLASVILIFKIIDRLYFNKKQAFFGACLFMFSFPVLSSGLAFLTDMSGWFFGLLGVYLTVRFYSNSTLKMAFLIGLLAGIGFLFKESGAAGAIFFIFLLLFSRKYSQKDKINYAALFALFLIIPILVWSLIVFKVFDYSYFDWYRHNFNSSGKDYNFIEIIKQFLVMFFAGWPFVIRGAWREWKERKENRERALVLSSMVFMIPLGLFWPYVSARVLFLGAAPLLVLGSRGLLFKKWQVELTFILIIVFLNYLLPTVFSIKDLNIIFNKIF